MWNDYEMRDGMKWQVLEEKKLCVCPYEVANIFFHFLFSHLLLFYMFSDEKSIFWVQSHPIFC
jgi:hypothetical protein